MVATRVVPEVATVDADRDDLELERGIQIVAVSRAIDLDARVGVRGDHLLDGVTRNGMDLRSRAGAQRRPDPVVEAWRSRLLAFQGVLDLAERFTEIVDEQSTRVVRIVEVPNRVDADPAATVRRNTGAVVGVVRDRASESPVSCGVVDETSAASFATVASGSLVSGGVVVVEAPATSKDPVAGGELVEIEVPD